MQTGEVSYRGSLQNFMVKIEPCRLLLTGSLAKFRFGNNIETLTRSETEHTIESLSQALGQPMKEARVFRLDIGQTFEMREPAGIYWRAFVTPPRMKRAEYVGESLTFYNGRRAIKFYDKRAESKRPGARISERAEAKETTCFLSHANLLRYEVQFKRVGQTFGYREIKAATLSDPAFYERAVKRWETVYLGLERGRSVRLPQGEKDVKSILNWLAASKLQEIGLQQFLDWIEAERRAGRIDNGQAFRLRQKLKQLSRLETITVESEAVRELDAKVRQAAAHCR